MKMSIEQSFAMCVPTPGPLDTPCLIWQRSKHNDGYGKVRYKGKMRRAHRVAYELANGPIPDGLHCLHKCDTPACVNVSHLFLGTDLDNVQDMDAKGRRVSLPGSENGQSKLNESHVLEIRHRYACGGVSQCDIAREFGIARSIVSYIVNRKRWTHI